MTTPDPVGFARFMVDEWANTDVRNTEIDFEFIAYAMEKFGLSRWQLSKETARKIVVGITPEFKALCDAYERVLK